MKLFRLAAETHHIDDARHLLELALQHPVLHGFQVHQAVALSHELVAIEFAYRGPRGELRLHPRWELHPLETIEDFLPRQGVIGLIGEITLDIGEPKQGNGPEVVEPRHGIELDLDGYGDLA